MIQTLTIHLPVDDDFTARVDPSAELVVIPLPKGGFDTLRQALHASAASLVLTRASLARVLAILADPDGSPHEMGAALADAGKTHERAEGNLRLAATVLARR